MYTILKTKSGYNLLFSGTINEEEMKKWFNESQAKLALETRKEFTVIIDMKNLVPLTAQPRAIMVSGQKLYKDKGMTKSAVILNNTEICSQFKTLAIQSGIYKTERYIDASKHGSNAMKLANDWVEKGLDPDKQ